ncbi:envelope integrity protein Cei [Nocardia huaxiensis]|uniref:Envelope integrity protein Cei n=1 Tax=Nocardia huaxiensis TaxID=2755382 RepID=A0A7D6V992_9NOCA|nr:envelope integrity protein Cei [Nocardia huaxiensis]QLY29371.1 envelope integrity protein Cei [Nocardia huaxiensis]UFS97148.1 envelope integrity protein Cei [Nocardia huaxiensis]
MVSLITQGNATDPEGRRFIRRRWEPWAAMVGVIAVICVAVWVKALTTTEDSQAAMACNSPSPASGTSTVQPAQLGSRVSSSRLRDVEPASLAKTRVRVYNANGQRGQAAHVASGLSDLGFASAPEAFGNDPVYVNGDLECMGQIRFGVNGRPGASALQLVAPCAELIEDSRTDDTVDLVLGSLFRDLRPSTDAEEVLRSLKNPVQGAGSGIDPKLLEAARHAKC